MSPYIMPGIRRSELTFEAILKTVVDHFSIKKELLLKRNRKTELVFARKLICYFARKYTDMTLKGIAERLSFDHTTVIHAVSSIGDYLSVKDEATTATFEAIKNRLKEDYRLVEREIKPPPPKKVAKPKKRAVIPKGFSFPMDDYYFKKYG